MKLIKVILTALIGSAILGQSTIFGASATKAGVKVKLLGEHGLDMVTASGGYAAAHELKARDTTAVSGGSLRLFGGIKEAAMAILGRHGGHDDGANVLFGANSAIATVTIQQTCGTSGTVATSVSPSGSYLYPEATIIKTCPPGSCHDGLVSQPSKATYVPGTIDLPGTTVSTPTTTDAPNIPASTIIKKTTVSSTTTNTNFDATSTISNASSTVTPTNYGPTAPPTAFEPVTGAASDMEINLFLGGCLVAFFL